LEIAVIGSGISGLSASLFLSKNNDVTLYEKNNYLGGHTNTKTINYRDKKINVDTGFIVFNKLNYPSLLKLFDFYNVAYEDSDMSLSVSNLQNNIEWSGQSINTIFADRYRIFDIKFLRFLIDILRFNRFVKKNIDELSNDRRPLSEWLKNKNFSEQFKENYILPMSAAIWSMGSNDVLNYPISNLFSFFIIIDFFMKKN
jgi:Predicted NAD/FAD-binding protein